MEQPLVWPACREAEPGSGRPAPPGRAQGKEPVKELVKEQQEWPRQADQAHPEGLPWAIGAAQGDRWAVWRRLQELGIPCTCRADRPLLATVDSPLAVWQVWHVLRMQGAPAPLRDWLERCYEAVL